MKLFELDITPTRKVFHPKNERKPDLVNAFARAERERRVLGKDKDKMAPTLLKIGDTGAFAKAYTRGATPGVVTKVGEFTGTPSQDGYLSYVQAILRHNRISANPFLPRVYSIKMYKNPDDGEGNGWSGGQYVVQMEKLRKIKELSIEQLDAMGEMLFHNWEKMAPKGVTEPKRYADRLLYTIAMATSARWPKYTKALRDKKLIQAVALISNLAKAKKDHTEIEVDLHADNFMYRTTSVGPQLVITDPLA